MNTTKLKLTNPTDDELSAAVAEHVAGWTDAEIKVTGTGVFYGQTDVPPYSISADAVLPLLERAYRKSSVADHSFCVEINWLPPHQRNCSGYEWAYCVQIFPAHEGTKCGTADTLPRAACIALLRANGIEVEHPAQPTRASS